jgi:hypothetical protein
MRCMPAGPNWKASSDVFPLFCRYNLCMETWYEAFAGVSLEEIFKLHTDNRAWNKALRLESSALVNSRLANKIDRDGYILRRSHSQADSVECKRRADILFHEITCRQGKPGQRP